LAKQQLKEDIEEGSNSYNVYFREDSGHLGHIYAENYKDHKEAILSVKETLVEEGDCLTNKAVLAVINGGKT
jgi:hypothetical protein